MPFLVMLIMVVCVIGCYFWWDSDYSYEGWLNPPILIGSVVMVIGVGVLVYDYTKTEERTIIVEGKDRGGDSGSYRVYTDGDTLAVKDIWFSMSGRRTNSADTFGDIPVCHKLVVTTRGWEFGAFDLMPNIDTVVEDLGPVEGCVPKV